MTQCEIYYTTSNPIHHQDSWFLNTRCRTGTPQEHLNQRVGSFPATYSPAPLGLPHALGGSAFPSRPSPGCRAGRCARIRCAHTPNRAGCTFSTSHREAAGWGPMAAPCPILQPGHRMSAQCVAIKPGITIFLLPRALCPATPLPRWSPSPCPAACTTPSLSLTCTRRG